MKKLLYVIHGPNLNLLGIREPEIYGTRSYKELLEYIEAEAKSLGWETEFFQSNHEGALIDFVQSAYGNAAALLINAGAYTHTSIALGDAVRAVGLPAAEVHLSDVNRREPYRKISYLADAVNVTVCGKGFEGYREAIAALDGIVNQNGNQTEKEI